MRLTRASALCFIFISVAEEYYVVNARHISDVSKSQTESIDSLKSCEAKMSKNNIINEAVRKKLCSLTESRIHNLTRRDTNNRLPPYFRSKKCLNNQIKDENIHYISNEELKVLLKYLQKFTECLCNCEKYGYCNINYDGFNEENSGKLDIAPFCANYPISRCPSCDGDESCKEHSSEEFPETDSKKYPDSGVPRGIAQANSPLVFPHKPVENNSEVEVSNESNNDCKILPSIEDQLISEEINTNIKTCVPIYLPLEGSESAKIYQCSKEKPTTKECSEESINVSCKEEGSKMEECSEGSYSVPFSEESQENEECYENSASCEPCSEESPETDECSKTSECIPCSEECFEESKSEPCSEGNLQITPCSGDDSNGQCSENTSVINELLESSIRLAQSIFNPARCLSKTDSEKSNENKTYIKLKNCVPIYLCSSDYGCEESSEMDYDSSSNSCSKEYYTTDICYENSINNKQNSEECSEMEECSETSESIQCSEECPETEKCYENSTSCELCSEECPETVECTETCKCIPCNEKCNCSNYKNCNPIYLPLTETSSISDDCQDDCKSSPACECPKMEECYENSTSSEPCSEECPSTDECSKSSECTSCSEDSPETEECYENSTSCEPCSEECPETVECTETCEYTPSYEKCNCSNYKNCNPIYLPLTETSSISDDCQDDCKSSPACECPKMEECYENSTSSEPCSEECPSTDECSKSSECIPCSEDSPETEECYEKSTSCEPCSEECPETVECTETCENIPNYEKCNCSNYKNCNPIYLPLTETSSISDNCQDDCKSSPACECPKTEECYENNTNCEPCSEECPGTEECTETCECIPCSEECPEIEECYENSTSCKPSSEECPSTDECSKSSECTSCSEDSLETEECYENSTSCEPCSEECPETVECAETCECIPCYEKCNCSNYKNCNPIYLPLTDTSIISDNCQDDCRSSPVCECPIMEECNENSNSCEPCSIECPGTEECSEACECIPSSKECYENSTSSEPCSEECPSTDECSKSSECTSCSEDSPETEECYENSTSCEPCSEECPETVECTETCECIPSYEKCNCSNYKNCNPIYLPLTETSSISDDCQNDCNSSPACECPKMEECYGNSTSCEQCSNECPGTEEFTATCECTSCSEECPETQECYENSTSCEPCSEECPGTEECSETCECTSCSEDCPETEECYKNNTSCEPCSNEFPETKECSETCECIPCSEECRCSKNCVPIYLPLTDTSSISVNCQNDYKSSPGCECPIMDECYENSTSCEPCSEECSETEECYENITSCEPCSDEYPETIECSESSECIPCSEECPETIECYDNSTSCEPCSEEYPETSECIPCSEECPETEEYYDNSTSCEPCSKDCPDTEECSETNEFIPCSECNNYKNCVPIYLPFTGTSCNSEDNQDDCKISSEYEDSRENENCSAYLCDSSEQNDSCSFLDEGTCSNKDYCKDECCIEFSEPCENNSTCGNDTCCEIHENTKVIDKSYNDFTEVKFFLPPWCSFSSKNCCCKSDNYVFTIRNKNDEPIFSISTSGKSNNSVQIDNLNVYCLDDQFCCDEFFSPESSNTSMK